MQEGSCRAAVVRGRSGLKVPSECISGFEAMQILEQSEPSSGVSWQINQPDGLPRCRTSPASFLNDLVGERNLTGRQKQSPPVRYISGQALAGTTRFASSVSEHVSDLTGFVSRNLREFVKAQERIA